MNTDELKKYIYDIYKKLEPTARRDGVYKELNIDFTSCLNRVYRSERIVYADGDTYHYITEERGDIHDSKTDDLDVLVDWIFIPVTSTMGFSYEVNHRIPTQDPRRIAFAKRLEYISLISKKSYDKCKRDIENVLKEAPYNDNRIMSTDGIKNFVTSSYKMIEKRAREDGIYYDLPIEFGDKFSPFSKNTMLAYSDDSWHYLVVREHKSLNSYRTKDHFELAYWILEYATYKMALEYVNINCAHNINHLSAAMTKQIELLQLVLPSYAKKCLESIKTQINGNPKGEDVS